MQHRNWSRRTGTATVAVVSLQLMGLRHTQPLYIFPGQGDAHPRPGKGSVFDTTRQEFLHSEGSALPPSPEEFWLYSIYHGGEVSPEEETGGQMMGDRGGTPTGICRAAKLGNKKEEQSRAWSTPALGKKQSLEHPRSRNEARHWPRRSKVRGSIVANLHLPSCPRLRAQV